ncbi:metaciclina II [Trypanosoma conorhini]|uniref:Metaciclina II n=1 Tax=Trypanosoma conorhini TaxID=83891 RepID=A0A3R7NG97_9TRYP|nr:metaciclina II [Trypanosoma conorhini]RNF06118.1 metaciclina II [Trypanosoma conorhini]
MLHCRPSNQHPQTASSAGPNASDFADSLTSRTASVPMRSPVAGDGGNAHRSPQQTEDVAGIPYNTRGAANACAAAEFPASCHGGGLPEDTPTPRLWVNDLPAVCPDSIDATAAANARNFAAFKSALPHLRSASSVYSSRSPSPSRCDDEKSVGHSAFVVESDREKDDDCDSLNSPNKQRPNAACAASMGFGLIAAAESAPATPPNGVAQKQSNETGSPDRDVASAGEGKELYRAWKLAALRRNALELRPMAHKYALEVVRQRYGSRTVGGLSK